MRNSATYVFALIGLAFLCCSLQSPFARERNRLQLYYLQHNDSTSDQSVATTKAMMDRAVAAGYTGVVLWDGAFDRLDDPNGSFDEEARLESVIKYATHKHLKIIGTAAPFSYALQADWAETSRVIGSEFKVDRSKRRLIFHDSFSGLKNPGFESGRTDWFDLGDKDAGLDSQVTRNGRYSAEVQNASGNARFRQTVVLKPWRQYRVRLFYKSKDFTGFSQIEVIGEDGKSVAFGAQIKADGTHDWTEVDYMFNSREYQKAYLYFGVWGGSAGTIWFDDIDLEETALVYVMRSQRTPLHVYDPADPRQQFIERTDFDRVEDPRFEDRHPFFDNVHDSPVVRIPPWSHLKDGTTVAMSYDAVFPIPNNNSVSMCFTDARVLKWLKEDAQGIKHVLPAGSGILMGYDEVRQMNSCPSCRARHMTAGQLLAWSTEQTVAAFQSAMREAPLYAWSDMYDPYHNAIDNYYYVEGDLAGSWRGLASNVAVMNWNLDHLTESLRWFSGEDKRQPIAHEQIIAGYYDKSDGAAAATEELQLAAGIPGITGMMYTTWGENYKEFEHFAKAVRAHWPAYVASVAAKSNQF